MQILLDILLFEKVQCELVNKDGELIPIPENWITLIMVLLNQK